MPKCKICGEKYTPFNSLTQKTCIKPECLAAWGKVITEKERIKSEKTERKEFREWRKKTIEKSMPLSQYIQICQKVFNTFIRMRDKDLPCISCGANNNVQMAAGHFFSAGAYPNLRFHEDNVHKQCNQYCNMRMSGNLIPYREGLIKKLGMERFNALEKEKHSVKKYTIPEVKELIELYRKKIKDLKN